MNIKETLHIAVGNTVRVKAYILATYWFAIDSGKLIEYKTVKH